MASTLALMFATVQGALALGMAREETTFRVFALVFRAANALRRVLTAITSLLNLFRTLTASARVTLGSTSVAAAIQDFGARITAALSIIGLATSETVGSTAAETVLDWGHRGTWRARSRVALERTRMRTIRVHLATQAWLTTGVRYFHRIVRRVLRLAAEAPGIGNTLLTVATFRAIPALGGRIDRGDITIIMVVMMSGTTRMIVVGVRGGLRGERGTRKRGRTFHCRFRPLLRADYVENAVAVVASPSSNTSTNSVEANIALVAIANQFLDDLGCHLGLTFECSGEIQALSGGSLIIVVVIVSVDLGGLVGALFGGVLRAAKRVSSVSRVGRDVFSRGHEVVTSRRGALGGRTTEASQILDFAG